MATTDVPADSGPWDSAAAEIFAAMDAEGAARLRSMSNAPWHGGVLTPRFVELVSVAINVAVTSLDAAATRRHMRAALAAGATEAELLTLVKMASVMSIHSCSLGAPILIEEAGPEAIARSAGQTATTPACDRMKTMGQWNEAWNPFLALDPGWTDAVMASGLDIYASGVFTPKETELLSIAFDASISHMYAPGTRRHIRNALAAGATVPEVMEVLKICVSRGIEACNLALLILADELARIR